jgi:hypothetical protein
MTVAFLFFIFYGKKKDKKDKHASGSGALPLAEVIVI